MIHFQKCQHFPCAKNPFFIEKFRKIEHILQEFLNICEKLFKDFQFLWYTINSEKDTVNSIIQLRNLSKNLKK